MTVMFLPEDQWSPRFDAQFYTIRMKKHTTFHSSMELAAARSDDVDDDDDASACSPFGGCRGAARYPAVYYEIEVRRGDAPPRRCLRRYSQFRRLCARLDPRGALGLGTGLPPRTARRGRDAAFLAERRAGLHAFLTGALRRPECANDPWIERFLELDAGP